MLDYVKQLLVGQFEAALAMLHQCVQACPEEHWENKIANGTFRWVAYYPKPEKEDTGTLYFKHFLTHAEYDLDDWIKDC